MRYELKEVLHACHTVDLFSENNKPIVQMLASEKITDKNLEQVELEIEQKIFWFERKFSKLPRLTLRIEPTYDAVGRNNHWYSNRFSNGLVSKFTFLPTNTVEQLAKAVVEVS